MSESNYKYDHPFIIAPSGRGGGNYKWAGGQKQKPSQPVGHGETKSKHLAVKPSSDTSLPARAQAQPAGHSQTKGPKTYIFEPFSFVHGPFQGGHFLGEINYSSAL
jgi:hypothetical protein